MLLNTKQVRVLGKAFAGVSANWTDKTSANNAQRRSVSWQFNNATAANALAKHLQANCNNTVTRTGVNSNWANCTEGGQYVRVIADLA